MIENIKQYLLSAELPEEMIERKAIQYCKHPDIAAEFDYWIRNNTYTSDGVSVEGYTAKNLADMSEYLEGEGSFSLLIMLRENPNKAKKKIEKGFRIK